MHHLQQQLPAQGQPSEGRREKHCHRGQEQSKAALHNGFQLQSQRARQEMRELDGSFVPELHSDGTRGHWLSPPDGTLACRFGDAGSAASAAQTSWVRIPPFWRLRCARYPCTRPLPLPFSNPCTSRAPATWGDTRHRSDSQRPRQPGEGL